MANGFIDWLKSIFRSDLSDGLPEGGDAIVNRGKNIQKELDKMNPPETTGASADKTKAVSSDASQAKKDADAARAEARADAARAKAEAKADKN